MTAFVLAVVALILALTALTGFLWLLLTPEPGYKPPDWVNETSRGTRR